MSMGLIHSIWTLLLVATFIGIIAWAFSRRRKQSFDAAARMPLEDDVQGRTNVAKDTTPGRRRERPARKTDARMSRATDKPGGVTGDKRHG